MYAQRICSSLPRIRFPSLHHRKVSTQAPVQKRPGNISDAFASLSGKNGTAEANLDPRYALLKKQLISGHEDALIAAWGRLLQHLRQEIPTISARRSAVVPEISYEDVVQANSTRNKITDESSSSISAKLSTFAAAYKTHGVAVVRSVLPPEEALALKSNVQDYLSRNRSITRGFPAGENPQVFELYWSPAQVLARAHPRLRQAHEFLLDFWKPKDAAVPASTAHAISYADRLRLRQPGDVSFALGPHVDGGSVERWEMDGYGRRGYASASRPEAVGGTYDAIFRGEWEKFDPWDLASRIGVQSDLYAGVGACSAFRAAQGWLSLSSIAPGEGHLLVNPLLKGSVAYWLMRPFFEAKKGADQVTSMKEYLDELNWRLEIETSSKVQGAFPGHGQEISPVLHPHLQLNKSMVHMPGVQPGDYVVWHCDTIHAVDTTHNGSTDSSVLYIPVCPLTEDNVQYLRRQRETFLKGTPSPDFGGGEGESKHEERPKTRDLTKMIDQEGLRAMGLLEWDSTTKGLSRGQREILDRANKELGFYM